MLVHSTMTRFNSTSMGKSELSSTQIDFESLTFYFTTLAYILANDISYESAIIL